MIFYIIALIYIIINIYTIQRIKKWLNCCHTFFRKRWFQTIYIVFYALLASSLLTAFLLPSSDFQVAVKKLSNYWLGTFTYILLALMAAEVGSIILRLLKKMPRRGSANYKQLLRVSGLIVSISILLMSIYGAVHAKDMKTKEYQVTINKEAGGLEGLRIGLVSDLHLGYSFGLKDVEKMVELLNKENLDMVCIAGDIYDNDFDAVDDPEGISQALSQIQSTYGTFATFGNHDVSERLLGGFTPEDKSQNLRDQRVDKMLEDAGVMVLNDEVRLIDHSFYLVGRLDASKSGVAGLKQKTIEEFTKTLDLSKPVLVMEHQPKRLSEQAAAGVDLTMSGHTHNGQLFPGNLLVNLVWENPYGLNQDGDFNSIVTSGVGVWGPNMRLGTDSEVVIVDVTFQQQ